MSASGDNWSDGEVNRAKTGREANGAAAQIGETAPVTASGMRRTLARARDGKALDPAEATILLSARGDDLDTLLGYASRTRDAGLEAAGRPGIITYSPKVFIPLTRLCQDRCGYCTFATAPARIESPYLSPEDVLAIARAGAAAGCHEALFTLGERPELRYPVAAAWLADHGYPSTVDYLVAMC